MRAVTAASIAIFWPGALIFGLPGVMATRWAEMFHVGRGAIGNTLFFVLAAVGLFMFFVGRLQEKFGSRKMVIIGSAMTGLSVPILAFSPNIFGIYLWAFLTGAASCFVYIPSLTIVQKWYPARRGLVTGLVNFTFGVSAAFAAPVFGFITTLIGYVPMVFAVATAALVVGVPAALLTGSPKPQRVLLSVSGPAPIADLAQRADSLLRADRLIRRWRDKEYDLRPLIPALDIIDDDFPETQTIRVQLAAGEGSTGRPEEVIAALGGNPLTSRVHRTKLVFKSEPVR
jgi:OFA family oxalate/formate antiporter-like MFS transporter